MKLWASLMLALTALPMIMAQDSSLTQTLAKFPGCAIPCLGQSIPKSHCLMTNQTCLCTDQVFKDGLTNCVMSSCTIKEAIMVKNLTSTSCGDPFRDKSGQYAVVSKVFAIISAMFVIQRFAYKFWAKLEYGLDDWFVLLTTVVGIPTTVMNVHYVAPNGIGRDAWTLTYDNITNFGRYFYILEIIYIVEVSLSKLAILFFYIRIFPGRRVRRVLWGSVAFVALFGIAFTFSAIFQCTPIDHNWLKWDGIHEGRCVNINAGAWSNAAISILLDGWMLAVPLWQLKALNLDWKKKIGVGLMFGVGAFVTIVSILRLKSLVKFGSDSTNPTWDFFNVGIWSVVEINVAVICACLPTFRLVLVRLFPRILGTSQRFYAKHGTKNGYKSPTRRGSRPMGTTSVSHVERSQNGREPLSKHITLHKTFSIEYGETDPEHDAAQLVYMKDLEMKSHQPDSPSGGSSTS
ncbi:Peptidase cysteine/serine, trypsin-like protein [Metarhizium brunneum]